MSEETKYTIALSETKTYEDGFADGYSRAWQECWEYFRELSAAEVVKEKTNPTKGQADE